MTKLKTLLISALLVVATAQAGTVYRDRFIPAGAPCMISFGDRSINANMIKTIQLTDFTEVVEYNVFSDNKYRTYRALRVTMINNDSYQVTTGDLNHAQVGLMAQIADCRK